MFILAHPRTGDRYSRSNANVEARRDDIRDGFWEGAASPSHQLRRLESAVSSMSGAAAEITCMSQSWTWNGSIHIFDWIRWDDFGVSYERLNIPIFPWLKVSIRINLLTVVTHSLRVPFNTRNLWIDWIGSGKWTHVQLWYVSHYHFVMLGILDYFILTESQKSKSLTDILELDMSPFFRGDSKFRGNSPGTTPWIITVFVAMAMRISMFKIETTI